LIHLDLLKKQQITDGTYKPSMYQPVEERGEDEIKRKVEEIYLKDSALQIQISELGERQGIFNNYL
jgi:hypothetical protein